MKDDQLRSEIDASVVDPEHPDVEESPVGCEDDSAHLKLLKRVIFGSKGDDDVTSCNFDDVGFHQQAGKLQKTQPGSQFN